MDEMYNYYGKFDAEQAKRDAEIVRAHYDADPLKEWERLGDRARIEFELNKRFIARYVKPGDRVLDCGGGPGRYSLWLAEMGCDVTLFDLSGENVKLGLEKAKESGLAIHGVAGDAREVRRLVEGQFDHVLLMGPLYHLTDVADRRSCVKGCLDCLKVGGTLSTAFISFYGGMVFLLRELIGEKRVYEERSLGGGMTLDALDVDLRQLEAREAFHGNGFTRSYMCFQDQAAAFMDEFENLEKLHFIGSEGVLAPFRDNVYSETEAVQARLYDFAERLCEREELLSFSEHFLHIGRKIR